MHYGVTNMPALVPRTSTFALTNATLPYVLELANHGVAGAIRANPALAKGVNVCRGKIVHPAVAAFVGETSDAARSVPRVTARAAVASVIGGFVGGLLGAGVMSAGHTLLTLIGERDTTPAESEQDEDATVKVADAARCGPCVGVRPLRTEKPIAGHLVHYGFGAMTGVIYGAARRSLPIVTVGGGAGYGIAVWLGAHAIVVPALGLAPSPLRQPLGKEARELVLHLAYGITVALVHRAGDQNFQMRAMPARAARSREAAPDRQHGPRSPASRSGRAATEQISWPVTTSAVSVAAPSSRASTTTVTA